MPLAPILMSPAYRCGSATPWGGEGLPASELAALPRPLSSRVLRLWLGSELSRERVEALLELCRSGQVHLAGTMEDPKVSLRAEEEAEQQVI